MGALEEKRAAAEQLLREVRDLEAKKRFEELWPTWKEREGSYWKFRNSYSCPQSNADYWWMHRRITNVTPDGCMDVLDFQIDKDGRLDVRDAKRMPWEMMSGWVPSTEGDWREAALVAQAIAGKLIV